MAALQERQPNQPQPLTTEAKDRIGNFYLSNLLRKSEYWRTDSSHLFVLVESWIYERTGARISADLANDLNLASLRWIPVSYDYSLSRLHLGKDIGNREITNNDFNQALATIEIARSIDVSLGESRGKYLPFYIRIAGVDKEQGKIIAAEYALTDNNRLAELNVLISQDEYMEHVKDLRYSLNETTSSIPTNRNNPYETAGLITEAMCNKADPLLAKYTVNGKSIFPVAVVLAFKFNKNIPILEQLGYFVKEDGDKGKKIITVGLGEKEAEKKGLVPWEISIPKVLQKA